MDLIIGMPGPPELCVIGLVLVLLFGNKLPKIARNLGRAIPSFKKGISEVNHEIEDLKDGAKRLDQDVRKITEE